MERQASIMTSKHQKSTYFSTILMLTFHLCLTQKSSARQHKTHGRGKEYMLKQVYSLLSSCTACKVQAKCCVVLFINLICSDMSDYVGKKLLGGGRGNTEMHSLPVPLQPAG